MKRAKCRNCTEGDASFGVFCQRCLKQMKLDRQRERVNKEYYLAIEVGAGDLWKIN